MKLLLRRDQRSGLMGKVVFSLEVRADLSNEEKANVQKYKLAETELYGCVRLGAHLGAARLSKSSLGLSTREQTFRGSEKGGERTL